MPDNATRLGEILIEKFEAGQLTVRVCKTEISAAAERKAVEDSYREICKIKLAMAMYGISDLRKLAMAIKRHLMAAKLPDWFQDGGGI